MEQFIKNLAAALEITNFQELSRNTNFRNLEEWGSLSVLSLIAMTDEEYGVELEIEDIKKATTLEDLYKIILEKQ